MPHLHCIRCGCPHPARYIATYKYCALQCRDCVRSSSLATAGHRMMPSVEHAAAEALDWLVTAHGIEFDHIEMDVNIEPWDGRKVTVTATYRLVGPGKDDRPLEVSVGEEPVRQFDSRWAAILYWLKCHLRRFLLFDRRVGMRSLPWDPKRRKEDHE